MQLDCAQRYGVASLKIKHHAQLGYVIEVQAAAVEKLRAFPELTLRQGMANGARFTTPDLSELDRRISEAGERAAARERTVFAHLVRSALGHAEALAACADALALLDVGAIGGETGGVRHLVPSRRDRRRRIPDPRRPSSGGGGGARRHAAFVPNHCDLSPERRVLLLTGPNMAGKSTYLRQNALIVVLAQAGLPVPAEAARIGVVDRLFSRVGASDDLARGRSTFMVEMTETAAILHQAGPRSLVVVDEIGRGTATLDGLAIAWAVLEALHSAIRCRTIFATHFHELAELADRLPAAGTAYDAGERMEGHCGFFARSGRGRGQTVLGRACRGTRRSAGAGGAAFCATACFDGETWRAVGCRRTARRSAAVCRRRCPRSRDRRPTRSIRCTPRWPNWTPIA